MEELRLFADYHQLHLFNDGSDTDLGDAWNQEATADQIAVKGDAIAIGTVVNVDVSVVLHLLDRSPVDDSGDFDHVVEASLNAASGRVVVMGCTDFEPDAQRFAVPPGSVRVRVAKSNLARAAEMAEDSDESPSTMERVRIQIWPAPPAKTVVVKRWTGR